MTRRWLLLPLLTVIFLDTFGGFFISPLLNALFYQPHAGVVAASVSLHWRNFYLGVSNGLYFILLFFCAPVIGSISDHIGRKKTLLLCLSGSFLGYLLTIFSIFTHNIAFFILGRIIDGASGGSLPIAQAAVIDVSQGRSKAVYMGYLTLSMTLGVMLGPVCGGLLSDKQLYAGFGLLMPFYVAAVFTIFNLLCIGFFFREHWTKPSHQSWSFLAAFKQYAMIPKNRRLYRVLWVYALMQLGWGAFIQFFPVILHQRFEFTRIDIGLYLGLMGIGSSFALGVLLKPLLHYFSKEHVALSGLVTMLVALLGFGLTTGGWLLWLLILPLSIGIALAYSLLVTMISDSVSEALQGWVMGATISLGSLAFGLSTFGDGVIADFGLSAPIYVAIVWIVMAVPLVDNPLG